MSDDWPPIDTAPKGKIIWLRGPGYERRGLYDLEYGAWCAVDGPHFMLPLGPGSQPTHWKPHVDC